MTTVGDDMSYWGDIARALQDVDPVCPSRVAAAALWKAIAADDVEGAAPGNAPDQVVQAVCAVDRAWLVQLGQDPDMSKESLDQAGAFCQGLLDASTALCPGGALRRPRPQGRGPRTVP